jgi:hypothetical protein
MIDLKAVVEREKTVQGIVQTFVIQLLFLG